MTDDRDSKPNDSDDVPHGADDWVSLLYRELRELAARKLSHEAAGHSLGATELVHEAYLRLAASNGQQQWQNDGHFFGAAAEAMRRILIDRARSKKSLKRGGQRTRQQLSEAAVIEPEPDDEVLALDEALSRFESVDSAKSQLVKLRYFAGLSLPQVAELLGISLATAERHWAYARAWLHREIQGG